MLKYNINNKVKVKLTQNGRDELKRQHEELWKDIPKGPPYEYRPPHENKDGWSEWPLWCLMASLGHMCSMGPNVPFETEVLLEVEP